MDLKARAIAGETLLMRLALEVLELVEARTGRSQKRTLEGLLHGGEADLDGLTDEGLRARAKEQLREMVGSLHAANIGPRRKD